MTDIEKIALSRIPEVLSKGENFKNLLRLHISAFDTQIQNSETLRNLKSIDNATGPFLDWFGVIKGIKRPKTTINNEELNQFFNPFIDKYIFSEKETTKPYYFGQLNYFKVGDNEYKRIIRAYCELTGFKGTIDEFSYLFKEVFGVDIIIKYINYNLSFIIENYNSLDIDDILIKDLTPTLPETNNKFYISPYTLFSFQFDNIKGTKLDFDGNITSSFYFPL